jgi:mono/diheme cytochrome c family protein
MRKPILSFLVFSLSLAVAVIFVTSFDLTRSSAQNANSSTTTNKNQNDSRSISSGAGAKEDFSKNTWELPADADKTKNPTAATPESIANGKALYMDKDKGNCVFCHGESGAGNEANMARLRRKPADLTNKEHLAEASDGELFWKISKGIRGIMPAREGKLTEAERWDVVNYVRTLGK